MTGQRHILVVDDDSDLRTALRRPLIAEGYTVTEAGGSVEAAGLVTAPGRRFDVILLDLGLPDGNGRDLCVELRQRGISVPIILLTGLDEEDEVVRGLDAGANDYVTKPFRVSELMARVRAQLRVHDVSEDAELTIGRFRFRPGDRLLIKRDGSRIRLTGKEGAVLKYLFRADGPVTRTELLQRVWGYNASATTHTVETHIYRLRQKLEVDPARLRMLLNEDGGYRLYPNGVSVSNGEPAVEAHTDTVGG
jgi:DNA-binding response OmpR family regulator